MELGESRGRLGESRGVSCVCASYIDENRPYVILFTASLEVDVCKNGDRRNEKATRRDRGERTFIREICYQIF